MHRGFRYFSCKHPTGASNMILQQIDQGLPSKLPPQPKTIYASKSRLRAYLAVSTLFLVANLFAIPKHEYTALVGSIFFGWILVSLIRFLLTKKPRIEISTEGLTLYNSPSSKHVKWNEIKNIRIGWTNDGQAHWSYSKSIFIFFRRNQMNSTAVVFPFFFGVKAEDLVKEMIPFCADRPQLIETMLADCKNGKLVWY